MGGGKGSGSGGAVGGFGGFIGHTASNPHTPQTTGPPAPPWLDDSLNETPTEAFRVVFTEQRTVTFASLFPTFQEASGLNVGNAQEQNLPVASTLDPF